MGHGDGGGNGGMRDRFGTRHPGGFTGYQGGGSGTKPGGSRGPARPVGDGWTPHYNGFPTDRVLQAAGMVGSVLSGSVTGIASGIAMDDGTMTPPDGWDKFGKATDTGGGVGAMAKARRRRLAGQVGNTLGIFDATLGA